MEKEEFIEKLKFLVANDGNIEKFVNSVFDKLNVPFTLNDRIKGVLTTAGAEQYNEYYELEGCRGKNRNDEVSMQLHTAIDMFKIGSGSAQLPIIKCSLEK